MAIVTGGSRGIGAGIVSLFANEGARVIAMDIAPPDVVASDSTNIRYLRGDVKDPAQCDEVVTQTLTAFGDCHVLINNAGISLPGTLHGNDSLDRWHRILDVNLHGAFYMVRSVLPHMMASGQPCSIINISSIAAGLVNPVVHPAYSVSKGALISLTKCLAPLYAKYCIRCNAICPGAVKTPLWYSLSKETREMYDGLHPLGAGEIEDVAQLAVYLASDESKWVTGSVIVIDGGNICAGGLADLAKGST